MIGSQDVSSEFAENINVEKLCRFCLAKEEQLLPIFDNQGPAPGLIASRIRACLSLEILENDELPKNICLLCHHHLEKYDDFRKSCESSEQRIRHHLSQLKRCDNQAVFSEENVLGEVEAGNNLNPYKENQKANNDTGQDTVTFHLEVQSTPETSFTTKSLNDVEKKQEVLKQCGAHVVEALQSALVASGLGCMSEGVLTLPTVEYPLTMHVLQQDGSVLVMDILPEEDNEPSRDLTELPRKEAESAVKAENPVNPVQYVSPYRCRQCGLGFSRHLSLQRHLSVHAQNRGVSCTLCQKWFPSRSSLLRHERTHTGEKPFACPDCPRSFGQKEILQRHRHVHLKERPFQCEVCGRGFTQRSALHLHRRSHAPPSSRSIQLHHCSVCPKVFCYASGLSRHILTHMGRVYTCLKCNRTFNDRSSSRRHARVTGHSLT